MILAFTAGGRERRAAWRYDVRSQLVEALDDEARWLSEDEQSLPGGLQGHPLLGTSHGEDEAAAELMATMRERRQRRSRRSTTPRKPQDDPGHVPGQEEMPDEVLPLEDLAYDPETMGDPPAAHPRGSAAEAAAPVGPDPYEAEPEPPSPEEVQRAVGRAPGKARRRRGLRLPDLAPAPAPEESPESEVTFARTRHDPQEVTFDEFFGTEEVDDEQELRYVDYVEPADPPDDDSAAPADPAEDRRGRESQSSPVDEPVAEPDPSAAAEQEASASGQRKGRTSVPSWDDIMFGSRDRR